MKRIISTIAIFFLIFILSSCNKELKNQSDLVIKTVSEKNYDEGPFQLITIGGSGAGEITYQLTDGNAAIVSESGLVTIKGIGEIKVKATKAADREFKEKESLEISIVISFTEIITIVDHRPVLIEFAPSETGYYLISSSGASMNSRLEIFHESKYIIQYSNNNGSEFNVYANLMKDKRYYFQITKGDNFEKSFDIAVEKYNPINGEIFETATEIELNDEIKGVTGLKSTVYSYTSQKDGVYVIKHNSDLNISFNILDDNNKYIYFINSFDDKGQSYEYINLEAGRIYYFIISGNETINYSIAFKEFTWPFLLDNLDYYELEGSEIILRTIGNITNHSYLRVESKPDMTEEEVAAFFESIIEYFYQSNFKLYGKYNYLATGAIFYELAADYNAYFEDNYISNDLYKMLTVFYETSEGYIYKFFAYYHGKEHSTTSRIGEIYFYVHYESDTNNTN